jgi:Holliday junction resolvase-like predicted endonuclease
VATIFQAKHLASLVFQLDFRTLSDLPGKVIDMNFGKQCEDWAAEHAQQMLGLNLVARNVYSRHGELDLICHDGTQWRFIEVKGRRSDHFGLGLETVSPVKIRRLKKCISLWMQSKGWGPWSLELWFVTPGPTIEYFELLSCH